MMGMLDEMLGEMLDAFDHPLKNFDELFNFLGVNVG